VIFLKLRWRWLHWFLSNNVDTLMDYREMWHVRRDLGCLHLQQGIHLASLMLGVFRSKKLNWNRKHRHLLVSSPQTNDTFDRLQCIILQKWVHHRTFQCWQLSETLLPVKHYLRDSVYCDSNFQFCLQLWGRWVYGSDWHLMGLGEDADGYRMYRPWKDGTFL